MATTLKRVICAISVASLVVLGGPTRSFAIDIEDWIPTLNDASTPYVSSDYLLLVQSGNAPKRVAGTALALQRLAIGWPTAINPNNNIIATIDEASTVRSIVGTVNAAVGSAATVSIYKAPSGTACSAGTVLHTSSINANGAANTNQTLTATTTALNAGDRLCLVTTGGANWTGGAGIGGVTVRVTTP